MYNKIPFYNKNPFGLTLFCQNYSEDPFGETWVDNIWLSGYNISWNAIALLKIWALPVADNMYVKRYT